MNSNEEISNENYAAGKHELSKPNLKTANKHEISQGNLIGVKKHDNSSGNLRKSHKGQIA